MPLVLFGVRESMVKSMKDLALFISAIVTFAIGGGLLMGLDGGQKMAVAYLVVAAVVYHKISRSKWMKDYEYDEEVRKSKGWWQP